MIIGIMLISSVENNVDIKSTLSLLFQKIYTNIYKNVYRHSLLVNFRRNINMIVTKSCRPCAGIVGKRSIISTGILLYLHNINLTSYVSF